MLVGAGPGMRLAGSHQPAAEEVARGVHPALLPGSSWRANYGITVAALASHCTAVSPQAAPPIMSSGRRLTSWRTRC